jgi:hypothetical protein
MNDIAASRPARQKRPPSRLPDAKTGQTSHADRVLATFGVLIALSSLGFAGYMISDVDRPPRIAGMEYLSIFAKPTHSVSVADLRADSPNAEEARSPLGQSIDPTPTGSIPDKAGAVRAKLPTFSFKVLYVSNGEALLQTDGGILHVKSGDVLPTLGRVNSIERSGDHWIVSTQNGAVLEWPPRPSASLDAAGPKNNPR